MKDGSALVVTLSFIPNFANQGPNADLSSDEGSEEVLEDSKDEPVMKTRVFDSDKDSDGDEQEVEAMGMCSLLLLGLFFFASYYFLAYLFIYFI